MGFANSKSPVPSLNCFLTSSVTTGVSICVVAAGPGETAPATLVAKLTNGLVEIEAFPSIVKSALAELVTLLIKLLSSSSLSCLLSCLLRVIMPIESLPLSKPPIVP